MAKAKLTPFQQALVTAVLEDYTDIPPEDEIELEFSPEFEARYAPPAEKEVWKPIRHLGKAARRAILIAIFLALLATTVLAVPAVQEAIIKFFVTESKDRYHINIDPEYAASAPKTIETIYCPTFIPEHYTHTHVEVEADRVCYRFSVGNTNQFIFFYQYLIPEDLSFTRPRSPRDEVDILYLNGLQIHNFHYYRFREDFVWTDNEYMYMLSFDAPEEAVLFEKIFSSIQPADAQ